MLKEWMHTSRATYNAALAATRDDKDPAAFNFIKLRNRIVPKASAYAKENPWVLSTPKSVRAEAIRDVVTAHKSNVAKRKKDPTHTWTQRFRSRKQNRGLVTLNVEHPNFKVGKDGTLRLFSRLGFGTLKYRVGLQPLRHEGWARAPLLAFLMVMGD